MNAFEVIKIGSNLLKENKIPTHILDSEILLSNILGRSREQILVNLDQKISDKNVLIFKEYCKRRSKNEPIAYITGEKEFWRKILCSKDTLILPETELMVENQIYNEKNINFRYNRVGMYYISLLKNLKKSSGTGIDISKSFA